LGQLNNDRSTESSNYTINSIWLLEQQAGQICNFGRKHQRYVASMQYKLREGTWARHRPSTFFSQHSLHKTHWSSGSL